MTYALLVVTTSLYFTEYILKVQIKYYKVNKVKKYKYSYLRLLTTDRIEDLQVPRDFDVSGDIDIFNKHGLVFIDDLLSQEQVEVLQHYIILKNLNAKRCAVIETKHRHHLTSDLDEDPMITDAVHSILTIQPLRGVMEEMLGLDAVSVELATITPYPGAQSQRWHKDASESDRDAAFYSRNNRRVEKRYSRYCTLCFIATSESPPSHALLSSSIKVFQRSPFRRVS